MFLPFIFTVPLGAIPPCGGHPRVVALVKVEVGHWPVEVIMVEAVRGRSSRTGGAALEA